MIPQRCHQPCVLEFAQGIRARFDEECAGPSVPPPQRMRDEIASQRHQVRLKGLCQPHRLPYSSLAHVRAEMNIADLRDAEAVKRLRQPLEANIHTPRLHTIRLDKNRVRAGEKSQAAEAASQEFSSCQPLFLHLLILSVISREAIRMDVTVVRACFEASSGSGAVLRSKGTIDVRLEPMPSDLPIWLNVLNSEVVACTRCPRLVVYREAIAREKRRAYRDWEYWGKPVPGFGDPDARVLILGLAPGAHGSNRTGRPFSGDASGVFMYPVLLRDRVRQPANSFTPG